MPFRFEPLCSRNSYSIATSPRIVSRVLEIFWPLLPPNVPRFRASYCIASLRQVDLIPQLPCQHFTRLPRAGLGFDSPVSIISFFRFAFCSFNLFFFTFWRSLYGCRYLSWSAVPKRTSSDQIVFQVSHPRPSLVLAFPSMITNAKLKPSAIPVLFANLIQSDSVPHFPRQFPRPVRSIGTPSKIARSNRPFTM